MRRRGKPQRRVCSRCFLSTDGPSQGQGQGQGQGWYLAQSFPLQGQSGVVDKVFLRLVDAQLFYKGGKAGTEEDWG